MTKRSVRSFVVRNGRTTPAQNAAAKRLLPKYGIEYSDSHLDMSLEFGRQASLWLEVGFGNGDTMLELASQHPEINILGVEVHQAGVGHALLEIERRNLHNVRVVRHDAMEVMQFMLPPSCLQRLLLLFPDPWHKKRHHKRRIVQAEFVTAAARLLEPGGRLHCATDWPDYAEWILQHIDSDDRFANVAGVGNACPRPEWRPVTRFEQRGQRLGHPIADLSFERLATG
ncbi:MAG: tRNA (guanosine(46)-N7)-methyltransferase TrmB [Granulosicoccus sp.]